MTDNRTTELRKLLDERGAKWERGKTLPDYTIWKDADGREYDATVPIYGEGLLVGGLTPEQAIAVTLGHGTLTAEQVREAIEKHVKFYEGGDYDEQAIADELNAELGGVNVDDAFALLDEMNEQGRIEYADYSQLHDAIAATLGSGTCEYVIEDNMNESEGMGDVWFRCTNCNTCYDYYTDDWLLKMPHCPKCGATVKGVR